MTIADDVDFRGQVVLVTGASRGLGLAYALLLAQRGATVVLNDQPSEAVALSTAIDRITRSGGKATATVHDVVNAGADIVADALAAHGRLDALINNAGVTGGGSIDRMSAADFDRLLAVNLQGPVGILRAAWPHFVRQGYGRVVNTASGSVMGLPGCFAYQTSKAALIGLTRSLALDGAKLGIRVNAVNPIASTCMTADIPDPRFRAFLHAHFPPEAAAGFVVALVSRDVTCNGELFSVGGGFAARVTLGYVPGVVLGTAASPGDWLRHLDEVLGSEGNRICTDAMDEVAFRAKQIGALFAGANGEPPDWSRVHNGGDE